MAAYMPVQKCLQLIIPRVASRGLHTSSVLCKKHIRAGSYKTSRKQIIPLTYEEAKPPYLIGVDKSWLTWNTSNLKDEGRKSETLVEDIFIHRFMQGTWHNMLASEVVVKRRHNMIYLAAYMEQTFQIQRVYFLIGYTEELLSCLLKCPVKLEIQTVESKKDMIFKLI